MKEMTELERLRHSSAHIMATAIARIWPEVQFSAGPPVENGFYYDFELDYRISTTDFPKIEAEIKKLIKENARFEKKVVTRAEAMELAKSGRLASLGERDVASKYKIDLINKIPEGEEISLFKNGDFLDLCAGPHVMRTGNCKAIKLMSIASTYYEGKAENPQLQRLYGTAFKNKTLLTEYLELLEKAKERDHRRIGKKMKLFHIDDTVGQGLILWKANGAIIRQELQNYISEELEKQDYKQVFTPHIGKLDLYKTSGHYPYYQESQFNPIIDSETLKKLSDEKCTCSDLSNLLQKGDVEGFLLKPMNCPHHIKIYDSDAHSYKNLPLRLAEFGTVYRWEQSGELNGMTRVRGFTQDDAHIFCTNDQVEKEIEMCLELVKLVLNKIGMDEFEVRLSLSDPDSDKYIGDRKNWEKAENALRNAVKKLGVDVKEEIGEAAFYGPKIDFVVKDVLSRSWQLGTVQVDYNLPERFDLSYSGADNKKHRPVMIHRAPFGSWERFIGILIEHYNGKFPTWLAPEQVRILPISEKYINYANKLYEELKKNSIRVHIDNSAEKIGAKIRNAQLENIPYMLIAGAQEMEDKTVAVRKLKQGDIGTQKFSDFLNNLKKEITCRT